MLSEIDSISWPGFDETKLGNPASNWTAVSEVSILNALQSRYDGIVGLFIHVL